MSFPISSNVELNFNNQQLKQRSYIAIKAFSITRQVKLIRKKEFLAATLDPKDEIFFIYVAFFTISDEIYFSYTAQIALLKFDKTSTTISPKYFNFVDVFSLELPIILSEYTEINDYVIFLVDGKQSLYKPIYSLTSMELKILKTHIITKSANDFIRPSKPFAYTSILFIEKPDNDLCLCIDYQGLTHFIIENKYLLVLISEFLDQPGRAK